MFIRHLALMLSEAIILLFYYSILIYPLLPLKKPPTLLHSQEFSLNLHLSYKGER